MKPVFNYLLFLCLLGCLGPAGPAAGQTVVAWGRNDYGQASVLSGLVGAIAVAAGGNHSLVLRADGSVAAFGDNQYGQSNVPAGLSNVIAVAAGGYHSLVLKADGSIVVWGDNEFGQTTVPFVLTNVIAISAGRRHSLALKANGSVVAWGEASFTGQSRVPAGLGGVIAVAACGYHSLALKADGNVVAWGYDSDGQSTVPAGLANVTAVSGGVYHSLALKADGSVVAWGETFFGQSTVPAGLTNVAAISAGGYYSSALRADGSIVAWGSDNYGQINGVSGLTSITALSAGHHHALALTKRLPLPIAHFAAPGQPVSIPGPGAKAGCTYQVPGLPAWLTLDPLTGTLSGTAPAGVEAISLTRELRYRAGYTVEEQVLGILPAWYSSYAAWQTHHFGSDAAPQSQPAADDDGDGLPNLMEFLSGSDPAAADCALGFQQSVSTFSISLDVLPGMETAAALRAQFSNDLTFASPTEVTAPSRAETLPSGSRRLVFEDPALPAAGRRFARLVFSLP